MQLNDLFLSAKSLSRYYSLPLLGQQIDPLINYLAGQNYLKSSILVYIKCIPAIDSALQQLGCQQLSDVSLKQLISVLPEQTKHSRSLAAVKTHLKNYLRQAQILLPPALSPREQFLADYQRHLKTHCYFSASTLRNHSRTVGVFLTYLKKEKIDFDFFKLTLRHLDKFIQQESEGLSRGSIQHNVSHVRAFLRYLVMQGHLPSGLEKQIETARVSRQELLPRTIDWPTIKAFLASIEQQTITGIRDYCIFLLMATYGLRNQEIIDLRLDDIKWREKQLYIFQRKTASFLVLPLTHEVNASLIRYLKSGRPNSSYRHVFLNLRAPHQPLPRTNIYQLFQHWWKKSQLSITGLAKPGPYCLRHSYAVHLLRQGTPLKTISDLLGHRDMESTSNYLRLDIEDLRSVPLNFPQSAEEN